MKLDDDETEYGGISFLGEKVKDFFDNINENGGKGGDKSGMIKVIIF